MGNVTKTSESSKLKRLELKIAQLEKKEQEQKQKINLLAKSIQSICEVQQRTTSQLIELNEWKSNFGCETGIYDRLKSIEDSIFRIRQDIFKKH